MSDKRQRIQALGALGLMGGAVATDIARIMFSVPFLAIPVIGLAIAILMGFIIGIFSSLAFLAAYSIVFKVKFTERMASRVGVYFLGSAIPLGTTLATAITIALIRYDDRRYNKVDAPNRPSRSSPNPSPAPTEQSRV